MPKVQQPETDKVIEGALVHIRKVHFSAIVICITLAYVSNAVRSSAPKLQDELGQLSELESMMTTRPFNLDVMAKIDEQWVADRKKQFLRSLPSGLETPRDEDFNDLFEVSNPGLASIPKDKDAASVRSILDHIANFAPKFNVPKIISVPSNIRDLVDLAFSNSSRSNNDYDPRPLFNNPTSGHRAFFTYLQYDKESHQLVYDLLDGEKVGDASIVTHVPEQYVKHGLNKQIRLNVSVTEETYTKMPNREKDFPLINAVKLAVAEKSAKAMLHNIQDARLVTLSQRKAKIFDIDIDGEEILILGAIAAILTMAYLGALLGELDTLLRRSFAFKRDIRDFRADFYPAWIGAQRGLLARILVCTSFIFFVVVVDASVLLVELERAFIFGIPFVATVLAALVFWRYLGIQRKLWARAPRGEAIWTRLRARVA